MRGVVGAVGLGLVWGMGKLHARQQVDHGLGCGGKLSRRTHVAA